MRRGLLTLVRPLAGRGQARGAPVGRRQTPPFLAAALPLAFRQPPGGVVIHAARDPGFSAVSERRQFERPHYFVRYRVAAPRHTAVVRQMLETREVRPLVEPLPDGLLYAIVAAAHQECAPNQCQRDTGAQVRCSRMRRKRSLSSTLSIRGSPQ